MSKNNISMDDLLASSDIKQLKVGDVVDGVITSVRKHEVWLDLGANGVGVVLRREIGHGQKLEVGEKVTTSVVDPEMDEGYALLSMKRAVKDRGWDELQRIFESGEIIEVSPYDANRGGLLVEMEGIRGFLPVSQLAAGHYPRVSGADKDEILQKLNALTGQSLRVRVLDVSRKDNKLIFSEKDPNTSEKEKIMDKYTLGDELMGEVTGVVDFGIFVKIEDGLEGLVHISEIDWGLVDDPHKFAKVGDKVKVKVIEVKEDKISLSIKALIDDPWTTAAAKYKKDQRVEAVVIKYNKHGALASIEEGVAGLVHVSEFGTEEELRAKLELGKVYPFTITFFEPKERRMTLKPIV
jgi:small subunit ribosomal protein S1